jgi:hypothetical protein
MGVVGKAEFPAPPPRVDKESRRERHNRQGKQLLPVHWRNIIAKSHPAIRSFLGVFLTGLSFELSTRPANA